MSFFLLACGGSILSAPDGRVPPGPARSARWSDAGLTLTGEAWADEFGSALGHADLDGDGVAELLVGAPGAGEAYAYDAAGDRVLDLVLGDRGGTAVAGVGDGDGDGADEIAVGATDGLSVFSADGGLLQTWSGDGLGASLAAADLDGDGVADLVAGAPEADGGAGATWVALGGAGGFDSAGATALEGVSGAFGFCVDVVGDVDADGYADLVAGAPDHLDADGNLGAAFFYRGGAAGPDPTPSQSFAAGDDDDRLGWAVAAAGDVDADGFADVLLSKPGRGRVQVHLGASGGLAADADLELSASSSSWFGASVSSAGDADGDGDAEVVVGAPAYVYDSGRVYLYLGSPGGLSSAYDSMLSAVTSEAWFGGRTDGPGRALAALDFDGDGLSDLAAAQPNYNEGSGLVEVHFGSADADGDGYEAGTGAEADCDDGDAEVHPGAVEVCNGVDDDCNGLSDDAADSDTWWADADGDGHGDPASSRLGCDQPAGHVAEGTDCDDTDADVHPGATEHCDDVDEDCDGEVDEDPSDPASWYADGDGDGVGATLRSACSAPEGHVAEGGDCDDADASVFPGATESCDDRDEDCDGEVDEAAADAVPTYADADGDGFGDPAASSLACTGLLDASDCDDTDPAVHPGATEHCDDRDEDCDGETDEEAADAVLTYADADGDGFGDPAAGSLACTGLLDATDCDDADPAVHPGATEHCDDHDEDCDGEVDEDAVDRLSVYADADGDGFGDPALASLACTGLLDATDCDDLDPAVHPDAAEHCDDRDEDCDGEVDEDAVDAVQVYPDADGDGFGDPATPTQACSGLPEGLDCDDADPTVHPDADEHCDDRDEDCDGAVDEGAVDAVDIYADADGDGWGDAGASVSACEGLTEAGDCDDADASVNPGADEHCDDRDEDCDGAIDEDAVDAVLRHPDADGDGYGDPAGAYPACSGPTEGDDCDDADPTVHPGGDELPDDGVDQDCDGEDAWMGAEAEDAAACGCAAAPSGLGPALLALLFLRRRGTQLALPPPASLRGAEPS